MRHVPWRKTLIILTILILLGNTSISLATIEKQSPNIKSLSHDTTLYVGGSGPNNYTRIQDAVNNASDGDTVYVYSGIYKELNATNHACIYITTSITLTGENKTTTILDGSVLYSIIRINANNITIHGFTIQHSGRYFASPPPSGIYLNPGGPNIVKNIEIYDTNIQHNWVGIGMARTQNITIHHNDININKWGCYIIDTEKNISLNHNIIQNNELGIFISFGGPIFITNNTIQNNNQGIQASDSQATITSNNFIKNQKDARFSLDMQLLDIFRRNWNNHWENNYWDIWKASIPKPILGSIRLYIVLLSFPVFIIIPLGVWPIIHLDKHPTQQPHTISKNT